jgi:hypothetical protein
VEGDLEEGGEVLTEVVFEQEVGEPKLEAVAVFLLQGLVVVG